MIYFSNLLTFVVSLMIGVRIAKKNIKYKRGRSYNYILAILSFLSFGVEKDTYLLKIFDFQVTLSIVLSSIFLGMLLERLILKYSIKRFKETQLI